MTRDGEQLSVIRYHDGFLGQRSASSAYRSIRTPAAALGAADASAVVGAGQHDHRHRARARRGGFRGRNPGALGTWPRWSARSVTSRSVVGNAKWEAFSRRAGGGVGREPINKGGAPALSNRAPIGASRRRRRSLTASPVLDPWAALAAPSCSRADEIGYGCGRIAMVGDRAGTRARRPPRVARDERQREAHKRGPGAHAEESPPHAEDGARDELRVDRRLQTCRARRERRKRVGEERARVRAARGPPGCAAAETPSRAAHHARERGVPRAADDRGSRAPSPAAACHGRRRCPITAATLKRRRRSVAIAVAPARPAASPAGARGGRAAAIAPRGATGCGGDDRADRRARLATLERRDAI